MGRAASTSIGVVVGTAVTVGGLYWLYTIFRDREEGGSGFGFGLGGSGKGDKFQEGAAGVADKPGETGGDAEDAWHLGTGSESRAAPPKEVAAGRS
ncbi:MAG: hypothetical protein R3A51_10465 [Nannocystaceae bacterium]